MKKIIDKFTNLKMCRQQKHMLRKQRKGLCMICTKPKVTKTHCLKHAISARELVRKRCGNKARNNSLTYRLETKNEN